jgi:hypothetical protein
MLNIFSVGILWKTEDVEVGEVIFCGGVLYSVKYRMFVVYIHVEWYLPLSWFFVRIGKLMVWFFDSYAVLYIVGPFFILLQEYI